MLSAVWRQPALAGAWPLLALILAVLAAAAAGWPCFAGPGGRYSGSDSASGGPATSIQLLRAIAV